MKDLSCRTGPLIARGDHFVGYWASRGLPVGQEEDFVPDQREEQAKQS
jgi:hypothetical protein